MTLHIITFFCDSYLMQEGNKISLLGMMGNQIKLKKDNNDITEFNFPAITVTRITCDDLDKVPEKVYLRCTFKVKPKNSNKIQLTEIALNKSEFVKNEVPFQLASITSFKEIILPYENNQVVVEYSTDKKDWCFSGFLLISV